MMMTLFVNELRLLWRHGMVAAYALVTIAYAALASALPSAWKPLALTVLAWSDGVFFSFFFVGTSVCLDISQGTFRVLFAGPVRALHYVAAKAAAISILSLLSSSAIALCARGFGFSFLPLALAALGACLLAGGIGMALAFYLGTVNRFMMGAVPLLFLLSLPVLSLSPLSTLPLVELASRLNPAGGVMELSAAAFSLRIASSLPGILGPALSLAAWLCWMALIFGPILSSLLKKAAS